MGSEDSAPTPNHPDDSAPAAVPVSAIRFCRKCGAPWDPTWEDCPHCAARQPANSAIENYRRDLRSVKSAVALYFALLAVSTVAIIIVLASGEQLSGTGEIVLGVAFSTAVAVWCTLSWSSLWPLLKQPLSPVWLGLAGGAAVCTYLLATVVVLGLKNLGLPTITYSNAFEADGYGFGWVVLMVCVQPAIFEELAFRGVIQSSLSEALGRWEAVVVTALMFAILHLSVPSLPHLVVLGLARGWLRMKTGSLYPGMVLHFLHNFFVILAEQRGGILPW